MKKITIVAIETIVPSTVTVPLDIFYLSSWFWKKIDPQADKSPFAVQMVTMDGNPIQCHRHMTFQPLCSINEVEKTDVVMIPVIGDNIEQVIESHKHLIEWLQRQYQNGATVSAVGTGVFILAQAGLLEGKTATTHWLYVDKFRRMYPQITLKPELLITDEANVICSGGNSSYDLPLYMIEKYCGHEQAVLASKFLVLDLGRTSQAPYTIFDFQITHRDKEISTAQKWINQNYSKQFLMDTVAAKVGLSPRTFLRRFKQATGETPIGYLQRYRIEIAKRMLETTNRAIEAIGFDIGYENSSFFRKIFKKYAGLAPSEYRNKF